MKERACGECGALTTNKKSRFYEKDGATKILFCDDCLAIPRCHYSHCGKRLTEEEKRAGVSFCLSCIIEINKIEIERHTKQHMFQIEHQRCSCGDVNDSRDGEDKNVITSRFCQACRVKFGRRVSTIDTWPEKPTRVFSRVTGFKDV